MPESSLENAGLVHLVDDSAEASNDSSVPSTTRCGRASRCRLISRQMPLGKQTPATIEIQLDASRRTRSTRCRRLASLKRQRLQSHPASNQTPIHFFCSFSFACFALHSALCSCHCASWHSCEQ